MLICEICKKEFSVGYALSKHIKSHHKELSIQQYYDKFILKDKKDKQCIICGNDVKFVGIDSGYKNKSNRCICDNETCIKKARRISVEKKEIVKDKECKICHSMHETNRALATHISHLHKMEMYDYYMKYIYNGTDDILCPICGKEKQFANITIGFNETCANKECFNIVKNKSIVDHFKEKYPGQNITNAFQVPENKEKIISTMNNLYGVDNINQSKEVKRRKTIKYFNDKILKLKSLKPLFSLDEYTGSEGKYYKWLCLDCNTEFEDKLSNGHIPLCRKCNPIFGCSSKKEKEVQDWIEQYKKIERNKFFKNNEKKYHLDIYIPENNLGIEFNGLYWHSEITGKKDKNYHIDKTKFFNDQNINILHIFENEWIFKQSIVKSIILSKMGIFNETIFARKCELKIINDSTLVKNFVNENHLQGHINSNIKLGLFYKNELVSIMTFGKSRFDSKYEYEMLRFCNKLNTNIIGGFSKLLSYFVHNISDSLITYCDLRYSVGNVYIKNGFKLLGASKPNYFYTKNYTILESRLTYQKHKLKNILKYYDENLTEWENMQLNGFDRIWDCGNLVFKYNK